MKWLFVRWQKIAFSCNSCFVNMRWLSGNLCPLKIVCLCIILLLTEPLSPCGCEIRIVNWPIFEHRLWKAKKVIEINIILTSNAVLILALLPCLGWLVFGASSISCNISNWLVLYSCVGIFEQAVLSFPCLMHVLSPII